MDFLKKPVERDTTPNSSAEILRRLGIVFHSACLIGGPVLTGVSALRGDFGGVIGGGLMFAAGAALHLTRGRWRGDVTGEQPKPIGAPTVATGARATSGAETWGEPVRILLLDASLGGATGNSARLLAKLEAVLAPGARVTRASLSGAEAKSFDALETELRAADALIIATGTHWDSWSSALQRFLEEATRSEATDLWLGKPVAIVVSEHSTGGKGVLSRLQGVLTTFGCEIPPLSGMVVSLSAQIARRHDSVNTDDFWCADDLEVIAHNLLAAAKRPRAKWRAWPVDRENFSRAWVD